MNIQEYIKTQELIFSYCKIWAEMHSDQYVSLVDNINIEKEYVSFSYQGSCPGMPQFLKFPIEYLEMKKEDFIKLSTEESSLTRKHNKNFEQETDELTQSIKTSPEFQKLEKLYNSKGRDVDIIITY